MWAAAPACNTTPPPCARRWGPAAAAAAAATSRCRHSPARPPACSSPTLSPPNPPFTLQPGYEVVLVGYRGAALIDELQGPATAGRLTVHYLPDL